MKYIIHLSDIHFRTGWPEEIGLVLDAFFRDLEKQLQAFNKADVFFIFSGDIVYAGADVSLYKEIYERFHSALRRLGIPRSQRICVAGNHDVSADFVSNNLVDHEGVVSQNLSEVSFNDYVKTHPALFKSKFTNYCEF
jgi:predicted MPP superfamily phosphohydrolase